VIENDLVLVVDEFEKHLHPLVLNHVLNWFQTHAKRAQLVLTTHNTALLSQKLFRRDQVWFMERDDNQATRLYPLSDFSPRENEAIERGYLNGRYGGIP
jgi:AAA15 family ATPase/GTPase